jgi:hypothetical protein
MESVTDLEKTTGESPLWPMLLAVSIVAAVLGPALLGFAPVGGDPELLYRPIKWELARALAAGALPFWSDRLGLGVPLVAESHVAAFYPLNWLLYRVWSVATAYAASLWLHFALAPVTTFLYARALGISRSGSALAAVSFGLCGFQAVHVVHEPFYHAMPYLPLCLLLADRYAASGRLPWLAGLALAWGTQLLLGHFQIQAWTGGLVLVAGGWRAFWGGANGGLAARLGRVAGLVAGLLWGAAISWVQLRLTWELTSVTGFFRPSAFLALYSFPWAHWAQFALPEVFVARPPGTGDAYWAGHATTVGEASAYVGVVPFLLAFVGLAAAPRDRALAPWRLIVPLSFLLASMPRWWPGGFHVLTQIPVIGWFRAPARYTLLTSLGLTLLAGRGLDESIAPRRFWCGFSLALITGAAAWAWSIEWARGADFGEAAGAGTLDVRFAAAGLVWGPSVVAIIGWRLKALGVWVALLVAALELGGLFYMGPIRWGRAIHLPDDSPLLKRLAAEPDLGLVAGRLANLMVYSGQTTAYPSLGIPPPPPNYLIEPAVVRPPAKTRESFLRWQRRFGVAHGVWGAEDDVSRTDLLAVVDDPVLDRVMASVPALNARGPWKLVRNRRASAPARVVYRVREVNTWDALHSELSSEEARNEAWFLHEDLPAGFPLRSGQPGADAVAVPSWNGRTASVEHDGPCILILRRTFYPGWTYQVDGGPERPVLKVSGGLQGVPLLGSGARRVVVRYQPTGLAQAAVVSLVALASALFVLGTAGWRAVGEQPHPSLTKGGV